METVFPVAVLTYRILRWLLEFLEGCASLPQQLFKNTSHLKSFKCRNVKLLKKTDVALLFCKYA
jgi:hypothetical protein